MLTLEEFVPNATIFLYVALIFCAVSAVFVYSRAATTIIKNGFRNKAAVVALGIVLGFTHITINYTYWLLWYLEPDDLITRYNTLTNILLPLNVMIGIAGAICHIKSATTDRLGNWGWATILIIGSLTGIAVLLSR